MANKKRSHDIYKASLGRHAFTRNDILAIEKLMRKYADAFDEKMLRGMQEGEIKAKILAHRRKFADIHVSVGHFITNPFEIDDGDFIIHYYRVSWYEQADSIKFLSKARGETSYFKISCSPPMHLEIRPFSCILTANRQYATGSELKALNEVCQKIEVFVSQLPSRLVSRVLL